MKILLSNIKMELPIVIEFIINTLNKNNYEVYIVGGSVRDKLLKKNPKDWDLTTNALPNDIKMIFTKIGYKILEIGIKHGTVCIYINNEIYEITTYRIDDKYSDNRKPDNVIFTNSLMKDLSRRDFTINAIAYNHKNGFIDYYNGLQDLNNQVIKAVGNANDRMNEDGLRLMRAVRFACQLGFSIESKTVKAIKNNSQLLQYISIERIREELNQILISNNPEKGIKMLYDYGLLQYIIPELCECYDFDQHNPNHDKDVFQHTLEVLRNTPNNLNIRLSALLHDIGKPKCFSIDENGIGHFYRHHLIGADMTEDILRRMKFDNKTIETVTILVKYHMDRYDSLRTSNIKKFINRIGKENLNDLFELQIADVKGSKEPHDFNSIEKLRVEVQKILDKKEPLLIKDLDINGYDLIKLGIKPSKEMGNILNKLLEAVLENPELNNKVVLSELVKNLQLEMPI